MKKIFTSLSCVSSRGRNTREEEAPQPRTRERSSSSLSRRVVDFPLAERPSSARASVPSRVTGLGLYDNVPLASPSPDVFRLGLYDNVPPASPPPDVFRLELYDNVPPASPSPRPLRLVASSEWSIRAQEASSSPAGSPRVGASRPIPINNSRRFRHNEAGGSSSARVYLGPRLAGLGLYDNVPPPSPRALRLVPSSERSIRAQEGYSSPAGSPRVGASGPIPRDNSGRFRHNEAGGSSSARVSFSPRLAGLGHYDNVPPASPSPDVFRLELDDTVPPPSPRPLRLVPSSEWSMRAQEGSSSPAGSPRVGASRPIPINNSRRFRHNEAGGSSSARVSFSPRVTRLGHYDNVPPASPPPDVFRLELDDTVPPPSPRPLRLVPSSEWSMRAQEGSSSPAGSPRVGASRPIPINNSRRFRHNEAGGSSSARVYLGPRLAGLGLYDNAPPASPRALRLVPSSEWSILAQEGFSSPAGSPRVGASGPIPRDNSGRFRHNEAGGSSSARVSSSPRLAGLGHYDNVPPASPSPSESILDSTLEAGITEVDREILVKAEAKLFGASSLLKVHLASLTPKNPSATPLTEQDALIIVAKRLCREEK